jgi:MFS family permease
MGGNRLVISETRTVKTHSAAFSATTVVLVLLCLMYGITYIDRVNVSTAALVFKQDLHLTNAQVGLIFSAFAYPYVIFTSFGGWLSDRFGARLTLTISALIWGGATLVTGLTSTLNGMLVARAVLGFGEAATFPIATRAMCEWLPARKWAFAQGLTHSSSRLGTAVTPLLVAWLITRSTWRGSFVVLGVISIVWAFIWYFYFRDDPATHPAITLRELEALTTKFAKKRTPVPWVRLSYRMLPVTLVYFCYGWTLWLYLAWIPSYFLHNYQLDLKESAIFSAGVFWAGVVGNTVGGIVSDAILRKTGNRNKARRDLVVGGFLCSLVFTILIFFAHSVGLAALSLSAAFFFSEFTVGPLWAIPMDIAPEFPGLASGLMNIGSPLAAIVSPLIFGYLIDKTGSWNYPFFGSIFILLCGSILAFWVKPEQEFRLPT